MLRNWNLLLENILDKKTVEEYNLRHPPFYCANKNHKRITLILQKLESEITH